MCLRSSLVFAVTALLTSGCWGLSPELPYAERCRQVFWEQQSTGRVLTTFAPEPAGAPKPPGWLRLGVSRSFDEAGFAEEIFPGLGSLSAPSLQDGILVCNFNLSPVPGIDGIDGVSGPLVTSSVPDLMVLVEAAGQKIKLGPKVGSLRATFPFKLPLASGQKVRFTFVDSDVFSADDPIGSIEGVYAGQLPFTVRGRGAVAVCGALSAARVSDLAAATEQNLANEVAAFEAHSPTQETPVDYDARRRIEKLLGWISYLREADTPVAVSAAAQVQAAGERQWAAHVAKRESVAASLPPPTEWVKLNGSLEGRVGGALCQSGKGVMDWCGVELSLRVIAALPTTACPQPMSAFGGLGELAMIASDGGKEGANIRSIRRDGQYVQSEEDVQAIRVGDVLSVEVAFSGYHFRTSPKEWDLPLLRVGETVLRVH